MSGVPTPTVAPGQKTRETRTRFSTVDQTTSGLRKASAHGFSKGREPILLRVSEQENTDVLEGLRSEIRGFIASAFKGRLLGDEEDIFATGFVNSLFAMELVTFIEKTFDITVESEDLDLDNFRSVERLAGFVASKTDGHRSTTPASA